MAVGGAVLQESDPGHRSVRRRQGGRQRPGRQAFARGAPRGSPAHHAVAGEEDRAHRRAVGSPGAGRRGEAGLRRPAPAPSAARGSGRAPGGSAARGRPSDEARAPPDRSPATLLIVPGSRGAAIRDPGGWLTRRITSATVWRYRCPGGPPGAGPREGGANPPRPRHCNRGRNPRSCHWPGRFGAGKAWGVGRSESQETCPGSFTPTGLRGRTRVSGVHRSDLILGGVRSGKSREALRVAASMPRGSRGAFLATAQALDGDMEARIARHRAERPRGWATLEEPYDVVRACGSLAGGVDVVVLDCLTLWVANLLIRGD